MEAKTASPQSLRLLLGEELRAPRLKKSFGFFPGVVESIPLYAGNLIEVLGARKQTVGAQLLKQLPNSRSAWMSEGDLKVYPFALAQEGIDLGKLLFLEGVSAAQGMEVLLTLLNSALFDCVFFESVFLPKSKIDTQLRRLVLTAEENGAFLVLFSEQRTQSFGITLQVETSNDDRIQILKVKGGR